MSEMGGVQKMTRFGVVAVAMVAVFGGYAYVSQTKAQAADGAGLTGRVTSNGKPVVAIPIRAHRDGSNTTVSVYTNSHGDYSYPAWSDLAPGTYTMTIELPDFDLAKHEGVTVASGKKTKVDFTLNPRKPTVDDASAGEIAMAMPGSESQKHMFSECSQCHSLKFALKNAHTREQWVDTITFMAGKTLAAGDFPKSKDFRQQRYVQEMADYMTMVRGPGSSTEVPFKMRPRPTSEASMRLVVTEYDVPVGGQHEATMTRGDRRFKWPHDVAVDAKGEYVYYTDNFKPYMGRLNTKTGEIKEYSFADQPGMGVDTMLAPRRKEEAFTETGGANEIAVAPSGKVIIASNIGRAILVFDPKTEQFKLWPGGNVFFGIDPAGNVWYPTPMNLVRLNPDTGETKMYPPPPSPTGYDVDVDSKGRFVYNVWRGAAVGLFDPKTETYKEYSTPSPGSGPRRGSVDAKDRWWTGLYWAGTIAVFDPETEKVKEISLIPGVKAYEAPFLASYMVAVDDKNQLAWTSDFNSGRMYSIDMKTKKPTEYFMPYPYEVRHLAVDKAAPRPTVWIPAYRPPSKIVKVQMR